MNIHVCLVSDQILANLIPALMEQPDEVLLVVSAEMKKRGQDARLKEALAAHGLTGELVEDAPEVSLAEIRRYAAALAGLLREKCANATVTLNTTGGTKLMMLGFVEVFREQGARLIYADTAHRRIEVMNDASMIPMKDVLDVPGYLAAQGMRYDRADSDDPARIAQIELRATLTRYLGERVRVLEGAIKIINGIVAKAIERNPANRKEQLAHPEFDLGKGAWGSLAALLGRCDELGIVEWQKGAKKGRLVDLESARYLGGIWLEEYAWLCARACEPFDLRMGVHRAGHGDKEMNEFDLLATHGNQLLFVECKTANFARQLGQGNDVTYKIDSLGRRTRGLFGETWLLSAIEPPAEMLDRARELRIRVLGPTELPRLSEHFAAWVHA